LPLRLDSNTIREPSGDQAGSRSWPGVRVSRSRPPPSGVDRPDVGVVLGGLLRPGLDDEAARGGCVGDARQTGRAGGGRAGVATVRCRGRRTLAPTAARHAGGERRQRAGGEDHEPPTPGLRGFRSSISSLRLTVGPQPADGLGGALSAAHARTLPDAALRDRYRRAADAAQTARASLVHRLDRFVFALRDVPPR
jgi:hypothetical protein